MTLRRATLLLAVAAACGGDSSPSNTPTTPTPAAVSAVVVSPAAPNITVGGTVQLSAATLDAAGQTLSGRVVAWTSGATSIAGVSGSGLVTGLAAGTATITASSEGKSGSAAVTVTAVPVASFVATGIKDIESFLEKCPTNDAAFATLRQDFEVRVDGGPPTAVPTCTEPMSTLPIDQLTDELIAWQILRTAFYMGQGTEGKLPWTTKSLYDWMKSRISGVNLKAAPGLLYCCDVINGKLYFSSSRQVAAQRDPKRAWQGISSSLNFYAHEIRHADPGSLGHTTGCQTFPLPTDPAGCDATYDLSNLGGYGVQFWLESSWALGFLNIGIGCAPSTLAQTYAKWDEQSANGFRGRFVTNIPPAVVAPTPFGGTCLH